MSTVGLSPGRAAGAESGRSLIGFIVATLVVLAAAALLAGLAPIAFSLVTVFLFAGPHNWAEARYILTRLPARWGKLAFFFVLAGAGVVGLTAAFAALTWLAVTQVWTAEEWAGPAAWWNAVLLMWVAALLLLRSRHNPRRSWALPIGVALALVPACWVAPELWGLALVYLHPMLAMWILDRELGRRRRAWRPAYRVCLAGLPLCLAFMWACLRHAPPLPGEGHDALTVRLSQHAGAGLLAFLPAHLLVATHAFLEMVHYGVWLLLIPLVGWGGAAWDLRAVPLARRCAEARFAVAGVLVMGVGLVLALWLGFLVNYAATRDIYFTLALCHVLAEIPLVARLL
jgi:hypothetical protein